MALAALVDLLFPPSCVGCARVLPERMPFCPDCALELERHYSKAQLLEELSEFIA